MAIQATMALLFGCFSDHGHVRESQYHLGWTRPLRSSLTYDGSPPCQLDHDIQSFLEHLQGW